MHLTYHDQDIDSAGQAGTSESSENVVFLRTQNEWGGGVERINQFDFYQLSKNFQSLTAISGDVSIHDAFMPVFNARRALEGLLDGRPIELGVSRGKAQQFADTINGIVSRYYTEEDGQGGTRWKWPAKGDTEVIPGFEWGWVTESLSQFEMIFAEEMRERATYRVPDRGIYNTAKLVDAADTTFPQEIAGLVPEKTKLEWRAAGRCMAFGMFTACGFHVARAVEGALESYFLTYNGKPDPKKRQWGEYLAALDRIAESGVAPSPDPKTMGELKQMKDDWRNPLMHPRVVLGEADARSVFNNGETLIMLMVQEIAVAITSGVQPKLALIEGEETAA